MEKIDYEVGKYDYFTPCPYLNKENNVAGIFVGDHDCYDCKYRCDKKNKGRFVICGYRDAENDLM